MMHPVKRVTSALLVVILCFSLLSGLSFAAEVNYQTGNPGSFKNVILNWGTRGTTATFLSPNAVDFYESNDVTYQDLSALSGASSVSSVPSSQLYKTLQSLMRSNHDVATSYSATKALYSYTDCQESSRSKMTCFYSGETIGPDWDGSWNREHTWPNSKGLGGSDENDIMMLRPTDISANSSRGNTAYGEGSSFYDPNEESGGKLNLHGDVARIFLYTYVRWGNTSYAWGSSGVMESKDILLKWMEEDPVDTWELGRNDSVESITGTRNVFVDYPELAFLLFNEEIPSTMPSPSSEAINGSSSYTITAQTNNSTWGSVSLSGKTITAVPASGYCAAGYTLLSGTAEVSREGNTFTISATSDCTIRIDFEAKKQVTVSMIENGQMEHTMQIYSGDSCILPNHASAVPEGYTFQGWVSAEITETNSSPARIYAPGSAINITDNTICYALYSYSVGGTAETCWELITSADTLAVGDQVVLASNDSGKVAADIYKQYLTDADAVFSADLEQITTLPDEAIIFTLGKTGSYWTLTNQSGQQMGCTGLKKLAWGSGVSNWTISVNSTGDVTLSSSTASYGRFLYNVTSPRFNTYTSSTNANMLLPQLYRLEGGTGTTFYTTGIPGTYGCTISGTITSFGASDAAVTLELYSGETLIISDGTTYESYILSSIPAGDYQLKISKENHVTRSYDITVESDDVVLDMKLCLLGDLNGDGRINTGDIAKAYAHVRRTALIADEYALACADVSGDSKLNLGDISMMYSHVTGHTTLF